MEGSDKYRLYSVPDEKSVGKIIYSNMKNKSSLKKGRIHTSSNKYLNEKVFFTYREKICSKNLSGFLLVMNYI